MLVLFIFLSIMGQNMKTQIDEVGFQNPQIESTFFIIANQMNMIDFD